MRIFVHGRQCVNNPHWATFVRPIHILGIFWLKNIFLIMKTIDMFTLKILIMTGVNFYKESISIIKNMSKWIHRWLLSVVLKMKRLLLSIIIFFWTVKRSERMSYSCYRFLPLTKKSYKITGLSLKNTFSLIRIIFFHLVRFLCFSQFVCQSSTVYKKSNINSSFQYYNLISHSWRKLIDFRLENNFFCLFFCEAFIFWVISLSDQWDNIYFNLLCLSLWITEIFIPKHNYWIFFKYVKKFMQLINKFWEKFILKNEFTNSYL